MIKGHTDIDIWNTGFFINADYFSDDFIIYLKSAIYRV